MEKFKKIFTVVSAVCLVGAFMLFAIGSASSEEDGETAEQSNQEVEKAEKEEKDNSNTLGKYEVDILSCRLAKDFQNKDVIIVKYNFKNAKNDNAISFFAAIDDNVYQDGVGLNGSYVLSESANYSADNQSKEIKKGASIEVEVAYELNDTTTDVEVEVQEYFSFDEKIITKTFTITE